MIEDDMVQLALRAKLATLLVATTGSISMSTTATGGEDGASAFGRAAGNFTADKLRVGMEVLAAGFPAAANGAATITHLTPTIATVNKTLPNAVAAGARSLIVGLPQLVSWENVPFDAQQGRPYFEEQYLPGGSFQKTNGYLEVTPEYLLNIFVPKGAGISADSKYVNALRVMFAPGTPITLSNGERIIVRRDIAPGKKGRQFPDLLPGFVVAQFVIPLRLHTLNSI